MQKMGTKSQKAYRKQIANDTISPSSVNFKKKGNSDICYNVDEI